MTEKKQTAKTGGFMQGALVLGVANLIVKVIGAVFKIPLTWKIGDDGMGYFNIAYQIYTFMFIVATAGFPIAISKMVAESTAKGRNQDARRIFQTAFTFLAAVGLIGSAVLFLFPSQLEALVSVPGSAVGISVISPAVFFVSLASVYRGYFQGRQNMLPTAASEVIEALAKLLVGLALATLIMNMEVQEGLAASIDWAARKVRSSYLRTVYASSGAILGVTAGTFLSFLLLSIIYLATRKRRSALPLQTEALRSRGSILKELILIAIPITIGASVSSLTSLIDMATITRRLVTRPEVLSLYGFMFQPGTAFAEKAAEMGWTGQKLFSQQAATLYGMYTGKALTMFNLPLTLVVALGMSVVPAISAAVTRNQIQQSRTITESAIRIAILFAAPCALGMSALSKEVLYVLFRTSNAQRVLAILAVAIIPVAVVSVTNSILQAYGKVYYPVINMIIGGAAKAIFNFFLIPYLGIDGAPLGTLLCYTIISALNIVCIVRFSGIRFRLGSFLLKPVFAALIMGAVGFVLGTFVTTPGFLASDAGFMMKAAAIAGEILLCGAVYLCAALAVRAIRREDLLQLPKGEKLAAVLTRMKLLK